MTKNRKNITIITILFAAIIKMVKPTFKQATFFFSTTLAIIWQHQNILLHLPH
jgi:hypothetical protein